MGSMARATYVDVLGMLIPFGICFLIMLLIGNKINILSLGDEEAKSLGVNVRAMQAIIIITATVLTSYSISLTGTIGWVGLVVPHLVRMLIGPNFKYLIPGSILFGGSYLLLMDDLCRSLLVVEIPLGIATSLIGIPFIILLLRRKGTAW
jgi:iron complex transport system permease protein